MESLGDRLWFAGRVRLDRRVELAAALGLSGVSDAALCLAAYAKWQNGCLDRLAGDFCFVIWDADLGRFIAARDQLGLRSLFHARRGSTLLLSDSLGWLAGRPGESRLLDDTWIADFLGFGFSLDPDRTVWRDIQRLPPGHALVGHESHYLLQRYWRLWVDEPLYHRRRGAYAEQFREVAASAISDRLPAGKVGVSMSGGLDSTALAALAVEVAGGPARVVADCVRFERLMPDEEDRFAGLAARQLGISLHVTAIDDLVYDPDWRARGIATDEPTAAIVHAHPDRLLNRAMAERAAVWFYGEGPDNALKLDRGPYFAWLRGQRRWSELARTAARYLRAKGLGDFQSSWQRYTARRPPAEEAPAWPVWLDPELAERSGLADRARRLEVAGREHPWHPAAMASMQHPVWQRQFASFALDERLAPFVWRHPFLDLRVVHFLLSVPPVPWARRKLVMREAMKGRLPAPVLARDKTPLAKSPIAEGVRRLGLPRLAASERLAGRVDFARLPAMPASDGEIERLIAVHVLDAWLTDRRPGP